MYEHVLFNCVSIFLSRLCFKSPSSLVLPQNVLRAIYTLASIFSSLFLYILLVCSPFLYFAVNQVNSINDVQQKRISILYC